MRYAIIDIISDDEIDKDNDEIAGEFLQYVVRCLNEATDLAASAPYDETLTVVRQLLPGAPIKVNHLGIPPEDDGLPETAKALLDRIRPWLGEDVFRFDGRQQAGEGAAHP